MSILPKEGGLQSSASMEGHEPPLILKTLQQGSLSMMDTSPEWPHPLRFRGNHSGGPEKQPGQAPWGTWSSGGAGTDGLGVWRPGPWGQAGLLVSSHLTRAPSLVSWLNAPRDREEPQVGPRFSEHSGEKENLSIAENSNSPLVLPW